MQLLREIIPIYQLVLQNICLIALSVIGVIGLVCTFAKGYDWLKQKWKRMDNLARIMFVAGITVATLHGGAKHYYAKDNQVGADTGIDLWEINVEYDKDTHHTVFQVVWTNSLSAVTVDTEVSYRESVTNDWIVLPKYNPQIFQNGISNVLQWTHNADTNDYSKMQHWWVGTDKPGIVVTKTGIKVTEFTHNSRSIHFAWTCDDPNATLFIISYRDPNSSSWHQVATSMLKNIDVPGFWYGKDRVWKISTTYETGGTE